MNLIIGNQAAYLRSAPIFPEYTMDWVVNEIDELADRPGAGFTVAEKDKNIIHTIAPFWKGRRFVTAAMPYLRMIIGHCWIRESSKPK